MCIKGNALKGATLLFTMSMVRNAIKYNVSNAMLLGSNALKGAY